MFQQQGAALQSYNNELIKCIDELCAKRDDLQKQIKDEDEEKNKIQNDIQILTEKLAKINESLAKKIATRNDYDKTISETEAAYVKIIDSSHTLLNTLHKEASVLKDKGVPGFSNLPLLSMSLETPFEDFERKLLRLAV